MTLIVNIQIAIWKAFDFSFALSSGLWHPDGQSHMLFLQVHTDPPN